ncbi:MAG: polysaccharide biosynthesis/export family protein [Thermoanaerobaculia bacterium]
MMRRSIVTLVLIPLLAPLSAPGQVDGRGQVRDGDSDAYSLGAGDVLEVFVWKEPDLSTTVTIRPDGRVALPLAGELRASGRTIQEIQERITSRLKEYLDLPVVTVMVKEINSPQISVLGEVRRPGRYRVTERVTILDAIALGGGFTEFADRAAVVVIRKTPSGVRRYRINVRSMLRDGGGPFYLEPRDTVYVD